LTRTLADNARLRAALGELPSEIVDYSCISIEALPLDPAVAHRLDAGAYDSAVFVSRNGVEHLPSAPPPRNVVAIGESTETALAARGWPVTSKPSQPHAEIAAMEIEHLASGRVLYVRGVEGSDAIPNALRKLGRQVDEARVYQTVDATDSPLAADSRPTLLVFASPSAVRFFARKNGCIGYALAIGETTARAARELGWTPIVAASPDVDGLVSAIRAWTKGLPC